MLTMLMKKNLLPETRLPLASPATNGFRDGLEGVERTFDRLFHEFDQTLSSNDWKAPLAVWEDAEHYYVEVELAGIPQDAVEVTTQNRQLLISYSRRIPERRQFIYNERPYGSFERRLALPDTVNVDAIRAEMRDGLLQITLDKAPQAQRRRIEVKAQ